MNNLEEDAPRLRVLLFSNLFPNPVDQTRGIFTEQLAHELIRVCDVTVVCPLPWFPRLPFLRRFTRWYEFAKVPGKYTIHGVEVFSPKYIVLPRVSEPMLGMFMFIGTLLTVWKLHRKTNFDVINSMWLFPDSVAAGWIGKLLKIPMVPTALGCDVNRMLNEGGKQGQIMSMLRNAPHITAVSDALRDGMVSRGIPRERISTIPNGVNTELFHVRSRHEARAMLDLEFDGKMVLFVGRLSEEKGLTTLIDAAGRLFQRRADFLLCLVGDGPLMLPLKARVMELGITANVWFLGQQDHNDVANWLGACDIFCLPSLREGCPNVVIEALSSGRPVVASRVGSIPDMLTDSTGILVDAQNVSGFSDALETALFVRFWDEEQIAESMRGATWRMAAENYSLAYRCAIAAT